MLVMRSIIYSLYMQLRLCIILVVFRTGLKVNVMRITLQEGAEQQRATPKDLQGEDWPWKIKTILGRMELDRRLDAYAD